MAGASHQTWALERSAHVWRFDVFREPHEGDTWICRRDTSIRRPYREVIAISDGIPYLRPEICLLFKAKAARDKDQADFQAALPVMWVATVPSDQEPRSGQGHVSNGGANAKPTGSPGRWINVE